MTCDGIPWCMNEPHGNEPHREKSSTLPTVSSLCVCLGHVCAEQRGGVGRRAGPRHGGGLTHVCRKEPVWVP